MTSKEKIETIVQLCKELKSEELSQDGIIIYFRLEIANETTYFLHNFSPAQQALLGVLIQEESLINLRLSNNKGVISPFYQPNKK